MDMTDSMECCKALIGATLKEQELAPVDCYVRPQLGIFIPAVGACGYAARREHTHPAYMVCIMVAGGEDKYHTAEIVSPDIPHNDIEGMHYYCILIEKEYFEERYALYEKTLPVWKGTTFEICRDILKALNTFMFEYSKDMKNAEITLDAQAEIITHWIIRSLTGESLDMRRVSDDYSVARAQQYMEQHYAERITIAGLAELGYVSVSCLNRRFKKETGMTPLTYLIDVRLQRAKLLLRRRQLSITEIATQCGFNGSPHFSACFREKYGIAPSEYRNKYVE